jgi:hypothetical protein
MIFKKLSDVHMMSEKAAQRQEMLRTLEASDFYQAKMVLKNIALDEATTYDMQKIIKRHLNLVVKRKKKSIDVYGVPITLDRLLALSCTSLWTFRASIFSKAFAFSGGFSSEGLLLQIAADNMALRDVTKESNLKTYRRHLSLLLRCGGFKNGVERKKMCSSDISTTGRVWYLPKNIMHSTADELIDNAEFILSQAETLDRTESGKELREIEKTVEQNTVIEDLI